MTVVQHSSPPAIGIEDPFAQKSLNYAKFWPPCLPSVSLWPPLGNPLNAHWPSSFYGYARFLARQYSEYREDGSYTVSETFPKRKGEREREGGGVGIAACQNIAQLDGHDDRRMGYSYGIKFWGSVFEN